MEEGGDGVDEGESVRTGGGIKGGRSQRRVRHRPRWPVNADHVACMGRASGCGRVRARESGSGRGAEARAKAQLGWVGFGAGSESEDEAR
jgi:hypothetical protein